MALKMAEPETDKRPEGDAGDAASTEAAKNPNATEPAKDAKPGSAPPKAPSSPPEAGKRPSSVSQKAAKPASVPPVKAASEPPAPKPPSVPPPAKAPSEPPAARPAAVPPAKAASEPPATRHPSSTVKLASAPPLPNELPPDTVEDGVTAVNATMGATEPEPARADRASAKEQVAAPTFPASARTAAVASGARGAYEALARSARLPDLVALAQKILVAAPAARQATWDFTGKVAAAADEAKVAANDAETQFGNALKILGSGADGDDERALASALWAHAIAETRRGDEDRLAGDILWLATHTAFDATPLLDRALGDDADEVWKAIGDRVRAIDDGSASRSRSTPVLGRGEAVLGCAALAGSESAAAKRVSADLAARLRDPTLARIVRVAGVDAPAHEVRLEGEAISAPRGLFATAVMALTGILFVVHAVRLVARLALAYKRPAEVSLSDSGVRMKTRTEMLGRTLREREHVIVRAGLVRVVREVRYPRAGFYAGLLALALGSTIGLRAFVDGVRAASPSLLVTGLVIIALGIGADFVLGSLLPGSRGRVRIAFIPKAGKAICIADVESSRADAALKSTLNTPR
jgi:hypothetical protein